MFARAYLCCAVALIAPAAALADSPDKGRNLLPRLFESAAADAADATVRVQIGGKDVVLGTVVTDDGYVLTKGSELFGKAGKLKGTISCLLRDGLAFDAAVVGYHEASDLMLLKVDAFGLSAAKFAPAKQAEPGSFVAVTGVYNPKTGDPETIQAVSVGVISSVSRRLYMQEAVIENANRGFLGIMFELSRDPKNTRIEEVRNADAKRAGLKKGDAIVAANDVEINSRQDLFDFLNDTRPGELVNVKVTRKGKDGNEELTFKFKLIPPAAMDRGTMQNVMGGELSDRRGGFPKVIQHDAVIKPEQCGGPLVDLEGRILGLNIARAGRVETWALPDDVLNPIFAELKAGKHPLRSKALVKHEKPNDK